MAQVFTGERADKHTARYLHSSKQHTDTVRDSLVNLLEHLAAKDPEYFPQEPETKNRARRE